MDVRPLSPVLAKKAEEELNENSNKTKDDLDALKMWMEDHPNLNSIKPPNQWLMAFLRGSKYNLEKCKSKIEKYYQLKRECPEIFANRDPFDSNIQALLKLGVFLPLRKCVQEDSPRICLARVGVLNKDGRKLIELIKIGFMILEILMFEDDNFTVAGADILADLKNSAFILLTQWTPSLAKKIIGIYERALSVRLKSIYVVNASRGITWAIAIFKFFIGSKIKSRIYAYDEKSTAIYNAVPTSVLPVEYGGQDGSVEELTEYWKEKIESYRDWFMQYEMYR